MNSRVSFETWKQVAATRFFVDKTLLLEDVLNAVEIDGQKFLCITRSRRFGKSVMANMVGAFLGKASDSSLFNHLAVAGSIGYKKHLNQHNLIFIDFSRAPRGCNNMMATTRHPVKNDIIRARSCVHWLIISWLTAGSVRDLMTRYFFM